MPNKLTEPISQLYWTAMQNGTIYFSSLSTLEWFQKLNLYPHLKFWSFSTPSPKINKEDILICENLDAHQLLSVAQLPCAVIYLCDNMVEAGVEAEVKVEVEAGVEIEVKAKIGNSHFLGGNLPDGFCDQILEKQHFLIDPKVFQTNWSLRLKELQIATQTSTPHLRKALLLDRDGVLIKDSGYVKNPEDVELMPNIVDWLKLAQENHYFIAVVTNQSGIGRGYYTWKDYDLVHEKMKSLLLKEGIGLDSLIESSHYPQSSVPWELRLPQWRKPRPGMILSLAQQHSLDLNQSIFVGDKATDLIAAALAGIPRAYLLSFSQYSNQWEQFEQWRTSLKQIDPSLPILKTIQSFKEVEDYFHIPFVGFTL